MARRDLFRNITGTDAPERKATPGYASRGASRNMLSSIGELAERAAMADELIAGGAVTDVAPELIDDSFVSDRMAVDGEDSAFADLVEAIRLRGQDSPVLLRPLGDDSGRYQIVFGHRRVRAARLLGRPVKAVIREVSDVEHVLAQGQENSARENLTFIERARFAKQLLDRGYDRPTVQAALSVDAPMLTRMLSVTGRLDGAIIEAIGPAPGIGRDRWLELTQAAEEPRRRAAAMALIVGLAAQNLGTDKRFEAVLAAVRAAGRKSVAKPQKAVLRRWQSPDKSVSAEAVAGPKSFQIALKDKQSKDFGQFITARLGQLYNEFQRTMTEETDKT